MATSDGDHMPIESELGSRLTELLDRSDLTETVRNLVVRSAQDATFDAGYPDDPDRVVRWHLGADDPPERGAIWLRNLSVRGFRGIGPEVVVPFGPGPGLTLIGGRNGSGKSSLAEAAEVALTGRNSRWTDRTRVWSELWRNLHEGDPGISLEFVGTDTGPFHLRCEWHGPKADELSITAADDSGPISVEGLGWADSLALHRPFLSYNELGSSLDQKPSEMYDSIAAMLGLDQLVAMRERVRGWRLAAEQSGKDLRRRTDELLRMLDQLGGERAASLAGLLREKEPDLEAIETFTEMRGGPEGDELRRLAAVAAPDPQVCDAVADRMQAAVDRLATLSGDGERERIAAVDLLDQAIGVFDGSGPQPCPVCGEGHLDEQWASAARERIDRFRADRAEFETSRTDLEAARTRALQILRPAHPDLMSTAVEMEELARAVDAWEAWSGAIQSRRSIEPSVLIEHLRSADSVVEAVAAVKRAAEARLSRIADDWREPALTTARWLEVARRTATTSPLIRDLKSAEKFLKDAEDLIRAERYEPIKEQASALWEMLRQNSNISLEDVALDGSGNSRKVNLRVSIDGSEASALGVMSQGELHALALALFLPRATADDSRFRFIVIDDPVQAMDPSKVDGLARVLATVAATRQVIVFTHDERLPAACRRLDIDHTELEVDRKAHSQVAVRKIEDPVTSLLDDTETLARNESVPSELRLHVVPVQCRLAVERTARELAWRKWLAAGWTHLDVQSALDDARKTTDVLGILIGGRAGDPRDVYEALRALDPGSEKTLKWINNAVHGIGEPLRYPAALVTSTRRLIETLHDGWG